MTRPGGIPRAAATAAAGVLVLGACTGGSDQGSPSPTSPSPTSTAAAPSPATSPSGTTGAEPTPATPQRNDCYDLRFEELMNASTDSTPVPCNGPHNAQTVFVGELPAGASDPAAEARAVRDQVSGTCARKLDAVLGGTPATRQLSRFEAVWFTPDDDQLDQGANWFRCDVVALAGGDRLATLPPPRMLDGVLEDAGNLATYGLCGTAAPGTRGFARVICSRRHSWRAASTIPLPGGDYPGPRVVRNAGDDTCRDRVRQSVGSSVRFSYGWEWPTLEQWRRGQRFGICWAPD